MCQPGKHGHTKCHFIGLDVFTGAKCETMLVHGHNADVPVVKKTDFMVYNVMTDYVSLMDNTSYEIRSDLKLPAHDAKLAARIRELFEQWQSGAMEDNKEVVVVVLKACGIEQITDVKIQPTSSAASA